MKVDGNGLSVKESVVVRQILQGDTAKDALLKAGYSEETSKVYSSTILSKPRVQNALRLALEKAGCTLDKLAQVAADGLDADRPVVVDKSLVDYPDHNTRHKFLETVVKLSGLEPAVSVDMQSDTYESRMMALIQSTQTIDSNSIVDLPNNCTTIIETKDAKILPENNVNDSDGNTNDSDCGSGI